MQTKRLISDAISTTASPATMGVSLDATPATISRCGFVSGQNAMRYNQAGIMVRLDERNWIKADLESLMANVGQTSF